MVRTKRCLSLVESVCVAVRESERRVVRGVVNVLKDCGLAKLWISDRVRLNSMALRSGELFGSKMRRVGCERTGGCGDRASNAVSREGASLG